MWMFSRLSDGPAPLRREREDAAIVGAALRALKNPELGVRSLTLYLNVCCTELAVFTWSSLVCVVGVVPSANANQGIASSSMIFHSADSQFCPMFRAGFPKWGFSLLHRPLHSFPSALDSRWCWKSALTPCCDAHLLTTISFWCVLSGHPEFEVTTFKLVWDVIFANGRSQMKITQGVGPSAACSYETC